MRVALTRNTIDFYFEKASIKPALVSVVATMVLWAMGGPKVTVAILVFVAALTAGVVLLGRRPPKPRAGLVPPARPAAL